MYSGIPKGINLVRKVNTLALKKNIRRSSVLSNRRSISLRRDSLINNDNSSSSVFSSDSDIIEVSDEDVPSKECIPKNAVGENLNCKFLRQSLEKSNEQDESVIFVEETKPCDNIANRSVLRYPHEVVNSLDYVLKNPSDDKNIKNEYDESDIFVNAINNDDLNNQKSTTRNGNHNIIDRPVFPVSSHKNDSFKISGGNEPNGHLQPQSGIYVQNICKTPLENKENQIQFNRKTLSSLTINDMLDESSNNNHNQHLEILDMLYGQEWRKAEQLVFSEPRPTKASKIKFNLPHSEIKPKKSNKSTNIFAKKKKERKREVEISYSGNSSEEDSERTKTPKARLFPKVVRKPLQSPWMQRLQKLCDADTSEESGKEDNEFHRSPRSISGSESDSAFETISSNESSDSDNFLKTSKKIVWKEVESSEEEDSYKENRNHCNILDSKLTPNMGIPEVATFKPKSVTSLNTTEVKQKGFLESLSADVPISQCHPSARIFRNYFQKYKVQLAEKLFKLYNEKLFGNKIPEDVPLTWSITLRKTAGKCSGKCIRNLQGQMERRCEIFLSVKVLDSAERLRSTLLHEMIHAVCYVTGINDHHGPNFKSWASRAAKVFPELPLVGRCHSYDIKTKYTYICKNCGYRYNRHSKSIDITKKVCARRVGEQVCRGQLEILINKTVKGESKSVPVTPKKPPSAFALFVKNNYAQCKTPELKHGEVMKILGSKFSELKLSTGN